MRPAQGSAADQRSDAPVSRGRQLTIGATLAAYATMLAVGISHHEPWADEAQAWLLSRDLGYRYLVFHQLSYEGVPPLWPSILWVASHWLHMPYQSMGWIGGLCALAGCYFFCRYSPFPLWIRILFPFTYFVGFQYAMVARPYVLLPLFVFAAAHYFKDAERRPWRFAIAASALTLLCAPGVMIAIALVTSRTWYTFRSWRNIPPFERKQLISALILFAVVLALVALVNWPRPDHSFARLDRPATKDSNLGIGLLPRDFSVAFYGSAIPAVAFLAVVGSWCAWRRRFLPFLLPLAFVTAFFVEVYGNLWHCGALTLAVFAALWIAWAANEAKAPKLLTAIMVVGIGGLLAVQLNWTVRTFWMDYTQAYSGSLDAANYLHSVGADRSTTCGLDFPGVAVQPYFSTSLYGNWPEGEAFWRLEQGLHSYRGCDGARWAVLSHCCSFDPEMWRAFYESDRAVRSQGFSPVHVSKGSMFFEGREVEPTDFVIYESK